MGEGMVDIACTNYDPLDTSRQRSIVLESLAMLGTVRAGVRSGELIKPCYAGKGVDCGFRKISGTSSLPIHRRPVSQQDEGRLRSSLVDVRRRRQVASRGPLLR